AGESFFSGWDFFAAADPTDGSVTYVSQSAAQSLSLISASAQSAIMRVSTAQPLPAGYANRPSVRITTQRTFTGGLLIGDIKHMPVGCGTWPAFWSNGPNWPAGGEIDIIEGVADATHNTASIHTNPGCTIPYDYGASGTPALAGQEGYNCAAAETGDSGCGLTDTTPNNYGTPFNNAGGGVFAMKWDSSGIAVYFWSRANVPSDITSSTPDPSGWPEPIGAWPASQCNPYEYFYNNVAIFDTTLCGQWAGNAWSSAAYGASQSCAQSTGYTTCDAYVAAQGGAFSDAYWEVYSVKLYQQAGMGA
ncbi:glycoside hydrolase family 16 protein, partial [Calocera cornea HHB12733]